MREWKPETEPTLGKLEKEILKVLSDTPNTFVSLPILINRLPGGALKKAVVRFKIATTLSNLNKDGLIEVKRDPLQEPSTPMRKTEYLFKINNGG